MLSKKIASLFQSSLCHLVFAHVHLQTCFWVNKTQQKPAVLSIQVTAGRLGFPKLARGISGHHTDVLAQDLTQGLEVAQGGTDTASRQQKMTA